MSSSIKWCVATMVGGALMIGAPVAFAAQPAPRLQGNFKTRITIKAIKNMLTEHLGETGVRTFSFKPRCKAGGCATVFTRRPLNNRGHTNYVLKFSHGRYRGRSVFHHLACYSRSGKTLTKNGFTIVETVSLKPTKVVAGRVEHFSGSYRNVVTPTRDGREHHCLPASVIGAFGSVSKPR